MLSFYNFVVVIIITNVLHYNIYMYYKNVKFMLKFITC